MINFNSLKLPESLFAFKDFFKPTEFAWEWIPLIAKALENFDFQKTEKYTKSTNNCSIGTNVFIHPSVTLPDYGVIEGPCFIGKNTVLRPGVYIRQNVIVGENCVLGNSCEYKNSILFDDIQTAHFNYVGDSILASGVHLGAGVILSNVRLDRQRIKIRKDDLAIDTNLKKMGAIIDEKTEIGCNSVMQPGTMIGKNSIVYPCLAIGGYFPDFSVIKK